MEFSGVFSMSIVGFLIIRGSIMEFSGGFSGGFSIIRGGSIMEFSVGFSGGSMSIVGFLWEVVQDGFFG